MRYLLDTHIFIWFDNDPSKLSKDVLTICQDNSHELFLSIASIWEIQIKINLGKIKLPAPLAKLVDAQMSNGVKLLRISKNHIYNLDKLSAYHKDPFDRVLISQSIQEKIILISNDPQVARYASDGLKLVW